MTYQQWNHHHYQAIPESRPLLMQPWQHEFGCPVPRPRSFSLGSRPTGTDLMQLSSKRMFDTSPIILPVDSNQNYWCNNNYTSSSKPKYRSRKWGWTLVFLLLIITSLTILAWWKLRQSPSIIVDSDFQTDQVSMSSVTQQQQNQQPLPPQQQSAYLPLPPPPAPLIPPGSQQQYYAQQQQPSGWQQLSPQQQQQHYQHVPPAPLDRNYQQQQYQQPYANPQYSYPQQYQQQYQQPHYGQQVNPHKHHAQHYANNHPEIAHQGEQVPRKSLTLEHVDNPNMPIQNDIRHQQHQQHHHQPEQTQQNQPPRRKQPQQPPPPMEPIHQQPMEPVLSRQEERAKARNQARTMNPIKNSTKVQNDDDIWEEKMPENPMIIDVPVAFKLRLEPAQFSFRETMVGKDGTIFMTSIEDDEDVTVEVIEDV